MYVKFIVTEKYGNSPNKNSEWKMISKRYKTGVSLPNLGGQVFGTSLKFMGEKLTDKMIIETKENNFQLQVKGQDHDINCSYNQERNSTQTERKWKKVIFLAKNIVIKTEPIAIEENSLPENIAIKEDSMPKNIAIEGNSLPENIASEGNSVPENIAIKRSSLPENIAIEGNSFPVNIATEGNSLQKNIAIGGNSLPKNIAIKGNSLPEKTDLEHDANDKSVSLRMSSRLKSKAENEHRSKFEEDLDIKDVEDDVKDQGLSLQKTFDKSENRASNFVGERICQSENKWKKQNDKYQNCPLCHVSFSTIKLLEEHKRIHKKSFPCLICREQFKVKFRLDDHLMSSHHDKVLNCSLCSSIFCTEKGLQEHLKRHNKQKNNVLYTCDRCEKVYKQKYLLVRHMACHNSARPFQCESCGLCFKLQSALHAHQHTHTQTKTYKCTSCDKEFRSWSGLKSHKIRYHMTKGNPLKTCDMCKLDFWENSKYKRHLNSKKHKAQLAKLKSVNDTPDPVPEMAGPINN